MLGEPPLSKTGTLASTLGTVQPFGYRGYVYDEETGLYYLRSRYYNPTWCRFVNADDIVENLTVYIGCNQFAYCINNPVFRIDEAGTQSLAAPVWDFIKQNGAQYAMADGMLPIGDTIVAGAFIAAGCLSLVDAGISIYNSIFNSPTTVPALSKKSIGNLVIRTIFGDALNTMVVMTGVHLELAQTILKDGISYSLF